MVNKARTNELMSRFRRVATSIVSILILTFTLNANPDLLVSKVVMTRGGGGIFVDKVFVTVTNGCRDEAGPSHLQITFRETAEPDSKPIFFLVSPVRPLRVGESQTLTLKVLEKKIIFGRHLVAEADTQKEVEEVNEDNNWRTLFPDTAGFSTARCK